MYNDRIATVPFREKTSAPRPVNDLIRTHAERMAIDAEERLQERRLVLAEQRSVTNPPDVRIRAWEKAHALRLPRDAAHPVLEVIAHSTGLTLEQVQQEQQARRAQRAGSIAITPADSEARVEK